MLERDLEALLTGRAADTGTEVTALRRVTGGASRETWAFDAVSGGRPQPLILRRDTTARFHDTSMAAEVEVMIAARAAHVPVPQIVAHGDGSAELGSPFIVMERVEGETLPRRILRDEPFAAVRPSLASACGALLARIHAIEISHVPALERRDALGVAREQLREIDDRIPAFELALRWLELNAPPDAALAVVHGDFRNGNLVVGADGIRAVLDWELAHIGDPFEDLGWMCLRPWRFGSPLEAGGFGSREELFAGYEEAGGRAVDADAVAWWEVAGTLRWGVGNLRMASEQLAGRARSVELAAIGRRTVEAAYDAVALIEDRLARS